MIYLIADTHFNHANIIKYCDRPFQTVEEMNEALIANWNKVVEENDMVIFLGDLCFKDDANVWLAKLNGDKVVIRGNHDSIGKLGTRFEYNKEVFLLTHRMMPLVGRNIWNIHGHSHDKGNLINKENSSICVSAELVNYTPIEISVLLGIRDKCGIV
jgi:calcineurin-like phosphoesterase family protein